MKQDGKDRRVRRLSLTQDGIVTIERAVLVWRVEHMKMDLEHGETEVAKLRSQLLEFGSPLVKAAAA
jgi:uncharacterized membrane protein YjjP (DUF1212 family)